MNLLAISLLAARPARWNYVSPLTWLNFTMVQANATIETRYVHNTRSKIKIEQELIFALPLRLPFWRPHFLLFRIGKCKSKLNVKYKGKDLVKRKRSRIQIVRRLPRRPSMCTCERSLGTQQVWASKQQKQLTIAKRASANLTHEPKNLQTQTCHNTIKNSIHRMQHPQRTRCNHISIHRMQQKQH